jgi:hypothetical protein
MSPYHHSELTMGYSIFLELVISESDARLVSLYNLNLAEIAVTAIKDRLNEEYQLDMSLRGSNPMGELRELQECLRELRLENESLKASVRKPSAFSRFMRGGV